MVERAEFSRVSGASETDARPWRVSWPREHGASLVLAGATTAACLVSVHPIGALGVGMGVAAAAFARGPIDRLSARVPLLAGDPVWLLFLLSIAAAGAVLAGETHRPVTPVVGALALATIVGSALLRMTRRQRDLGFELAAMGALGATAGLGAFAGGVDVRTASALAVVLGAHAVVSVPMVRTELRRGERRDARRALVVCAAAILAAALICWALGHLPAAVALVPRAGQIGIRGLRQPAPRRPIVVGLRESALLAAAVAMAVLAVGTGRA